MAWEQDTRSIGDRHEHERGCGPEAGSDCAGCGVCHRPAARAWSGAESSHAKAQTLRGPAHRPRSTGVWLAIRDLCTSARAHSCLPASQLRSARTVVCQTKAPATGIADPSLPTGWFAAQVRPVHTYTCMYTNTHTHTRMRQRVEKRITMCAMCGETHMPMRSACKIFACVRQCIIPKPKP